MTVDEITEYKMTRQNDWIQNDCRQNKSNKNK